MRLLITLSPPSLILLDLQRLCSSLVFVFVSRFRSCTRIRHLAPTESDPPDPPDIQKQFNTCTQRSLNFVPVYTRVARAPIRFQNLLLRSTNYTFTSHPAPPCSPRRHAICCIMLRGSVDQKGGKRKERKVNDTGVREPERIDRWFSYTFTPTTLCLSLAIGK